MCNTERRAPTPTTHANANRHCATRQSCSTPSLPSPNHLTTCERLLPEVASSIQPARLASGTRHESPPTTPPRRCATSEARLPRNLPIRIGVWPLLEAVVPPARFHREGRLAAAIGDNLCLCSKLVSPSFAVRRKHTGTPTPHQSLPNAQNEATPTQCHNSFRLTIPKAKRCFQTPAEAYT